VPFEWPNVVTELLEWDGWFPGECVSWQGWKAAARVEITLWVLFTVSVQRFSPPDYPWLAVVEALQAMVSGPSSADFCADLAAANLGINVGALLMESESAGETGLTMRRAIKIVIETRPPPTSPRTPNLTPRTPSNLRVDTRVPLRGVVVDGE